MKVRRQGWAQRVPRTVRVLRSCAAVLTSLACPELSSFLRVWQSARTEVYFTSALRLLSNLVKMLFWIMSLPYLRPGMAPHRSVSSGPLARPARATPSPPWASLHLWPLLASHNPAVYTWNPPYSLLPPAYHRLRSQLECPFCRETRLRLPCSLLSQPAPCRKHILSWFLNICLYHGTITSS